MKKILISYKIGREKLSTIRTVYKGETVKEKLDLFIKETKSHLKQHSDKDVSIINYLTY